MCRVFVFVSFFNYDKFMHSFHFFFFRQYIECSVTQFEFLALLCFCFSKRTLIFPAAATNNDYDNNNNVNVKKKKRKRRNKKKLN